MNIDSFDRNKRTFVDYRDMKSIGQGTYAHVYKANEIQPNGELVPVALKEIKMDKETEGFPITALREIRLMKQLNHPNILGIRNVIVSSGYVEGKGSVYLVFDYMEHDLCGLIGNNLYSKSFTQSEIKCYMKQILQGLYECHKKKIVHRDIKTANVLLNDKGIIKLGDFGLARVIDPSQSNQYTNHVVTLWYRAPELLLGDTKYSFAVDMWSLGCVFAELLTGKPLFPAKTEIGQLDMIFDICGTPSEEDLQEFSNYQYYSMFLENRQPKKSKLREKFSEYTPETINLIEKLLCLNPHKRITALDALDAEYFFTEPLPTNPENLPHYESSHESDIKEKRKFNAKRTREHSTPESLSKKENF